MAKDPAAVALGRKGGQAKVASKGFGSSKERASAAGKKSAAARKKKAKSRKGPN
jgi:hypothetical protein